MRLVAVARVYNEDDIIEAFVRHHAPLVSHFLFLDNGSIDRTVEILSALRNEGLPLTVFQCHSANFNEAWHNTWLYHYADQNLAPDWVLCLDADEFITAFDLPTPALSEYLRGFPVGTLAMRLRLVNYMQAPDDDENDLLVPSRLRWRVREPHDIYKIFARGGLHERGIQIEPGNHSAKIGSDWAVAADQQYYFLAHYPRRSGWHEISKATNGWLKVLAAGEEASRKRWAIHYQGAFYAVRDRPWDLVSSEKFMRPTPNPDVHIKSPLNYRGAPLVYTKREDPQLRALRLIVNSAEVLARQHGRIIDEVQGARQSISRWINDPKPLFKSSV